MQTRRFVDCENHNSTSLLLIINALGRIVNRPYPYLIKQARIATSRLRDVVRTNQYNWFLSTYTAYKLWTLGDGLLPLQLSLTDNIMRRLYKRLLGFVLLVSALSIWFIKMYARARLLVLVVSKSSSGVKYLYDKYTCELQHKQWVLSHRVAEHICAICPDWGEVSFDAIKTTQGCLDGLLSIAQSVSTLQKKLKHLAHHHPVNHVSLVHQPITTWSSHDWDLILTELEKLAREGLDIFNVSQFVLPNVTLEEDSVKQLAGFINNTVIKTLDLNRLAIGDDNFDLLFWSFLKTNVSVLNLAYNELSTASYAKLANNTLGQGYVKWLSLAGNIADGSGLSFIATSLFNTSLEYIDISNTTVAYSHHVDHQIL